MSQNTDLIDRFIASWKSMNIEQIMSFFTEDAVYVNIPIEPPNVGREMIRKAIEGFLGMSKGIEFVVYHTAENPAAGIVMNERLDRFNTGHKWVEARVTGVFEIRDGRIKAWRDYFDLAQFQRQLAPPGQ